MLVYSRYHERLFSRSEVKVDHPFEIFFMIYFFIIALFIQILYLIKEARCLFFIKMTNLKYVN